MGGKRSRVGPRHRWNNDIKLYFKQIRSEGVKWIYLAYERRKFQCRGLMNKIISRIILRKEANTLSSRHTSSFIRLILLWRLLCGSLRGLRPYLALCTSAAQQPVLCGVWINIGSFTLVRKLRGVIARLNRVSARGNKMKMFLELVLYQSAFNCEASCSFDVDTHRVSSSYAELTLQKL